MIHPNLTFGMDYGKGRDDCWLRERIIIRNSFDERNRIREQLSQQIIRRRHEFHDFSSLKEIMEEEIVCNRERDLADERITITN